MSDFMIFVTKKYCCLKNKSIHFKFVLNFWQTGLDKALKIGIVPPKSGRMVSLSLTKASCYEVTDNFKIHLKEKKGQKLPTFIFDY